MDIEISGLPANTTGTVIKRIANAQHVVDASVTADHLKGTCTGEGRIKVRLSQGESAE